MCAPSFNSCSAWPLQKLMYIQVARWTTDCVQLALAKTQHHSGRATHEFLVILLCVKMGIENASFVRCMCCSHQWLKDPSVFETWWHLQIQNIFKCGIAKQGGYIIFIARYISLTLFCIRIERCALLKVLMRVTLSWYRSFFIYFLGILFVNSGTLMF